MKTHSRRDAIRHRIAEEAARLLANADAPDFAAARRKAAARLRCTDKRNLPDNQTIDAALRNYRQLFCSTDRSQAQELAMQRTQALEAMRHLAEFSPRLTGTVLDGSADVSTPIRLFVFADTTEQLQIRLMALGIPANQSALTMRHANGEIRQHDCFEFQAGEFTFELVLFKPNERANPPLDPISEKPNLGASLAQAERLFASK